MKTLLCIAISALAFTGCHRQQTENDLPPVNTPRPDPIVKPTNQVGVPLTNVPVTTSSNK